MARSVRVAALAAVEAEERVLPLWWTNTAGVCRSDGPSCSSVGKHPLVEGGLHAATNDPAQVHEWWQRWSLANLGIRTDAIHRFDIDIVEVAKAVMVERALAYETPLVRTIKPGLHLSFLPQVALKTHNLFLADGRRLGELRGLDAYVVAPPSRVGRHYYELLSPSFVKPLRLADPEAWLAELLKEFGFELGKAPAEREYKRLAGVIHEGQGRHTALTSYAGRIWFEGVNEEVFAGSLRLMNESQCRPPLPEHELLAFAQHFIRNRGQTRILSAAPRDVVPAERNETALRFRTAREITASTSTETPWIAKPWVALGALTEVDGKVKASGKTTFITLLCRAVLDGRTFTSQPTRQSPVVYLTEQGDSSFLQALRRADLLEREDFVVLSWHLARDRSWNEIVTRATQECIRIGARLLIADTLPQFAGIEGDGENASGPALEAVRPLQEAAFTHNLGVIFSRHERKSGGEVGDSGRGSSAFAGAVDIVLSLRRREGQGNPNIRVIHTLSRFDETPDSLVIELTEGGYRVLGDELSLGRHEARQRLEDGLPRSQEAALTLDDVVDLVKLGRSSVQEVLAILAEEGCVERLGAGRKGNPFRYWWK